MPHATLQCSNSKTCIITHELNVRMDWKFGNKQILIISTELCHKIIYQLGSQNGPLI